MFAPLIPVNADRSQHEDAANCSPSRLPFQFLSSSLHTSGPCSFSLPRPSLFIFPSCTLQSCSSKSPCLSFCIAVRQGQKKTVENGLWRNVCSSSGRNQKERHSTSSFDLLSPLFLMVLMQLYQSLIMSDPATKSFTHTYYMPIWVKKYTWNTI